MNQLTMSEQAIYDIIVNEGSKTRAIAERLGYTIRTLETKIDTICEKKGVTNQKELIVKHYKEIISRGTLCPSVSNL